MITICDIDHLVLRVSDLDAMLRFYCDALGCAVERRLDSIGLVQLRAGRSLIDLVPVDGPLGRAGGAGPGPQGRNLDHFCLRVEPFDETAIRARLMALGIRVGAVASRYGAQGEGPSLYISDPQGNTVELKGPPHTPAPTSAGARPFLPESFEVPARIDAPRFRLRTLTMHDVVKDYDAVMSSREHLWQRFGTEWGWPRADLTLEQDLIDLAWHQKEFQLRSAFAYAAMSLDETRLLGCLYVDPPRNPAVDASVWFWARASELASGLEGAMECFALEWLARDWPFALVEMNRTPRALRRTG